jgi:hypothetical protein
MPHGAASKILLGNSMDRINAQGGAYRGSPDVGKIPDNAPSPKLSGNAQFNSKKQERGAESNPSFIFDTRPTPIFLPKHRKNGKKRSREDEAIDMRDPKATVAPSGGERKKVKGLYRYGGSPTPTTTFIPQVEGEDISEEVESRLKAKEERRRKRQEKREKKRKRDSANSNAEASATEGIMPPRNKKSKTSPKDNSSDNPMKGEKKVEKRRAADDVALEQEGGESAQDGTKMKKRKEDQVGSVR